MKIVFLGSGEFAVPTLRALARVTELQAVVTQPDRPAGRGLSLRPTPVKEEALRLELTLRQYPSLRDAAVAEELRAWTPDALVVAAYGKILPPQLLEIPKLGAINLHASLLPKYRGAAPIHWALIRGERQSGVTTFFMDAGMDSGPLLLQHAVRIEEEDNVLTLESKLAQVGALLVLETLERLTKGDLRPVPQDEALVTFAPKLKKQDGQLFWNEPARALFNRVRGTTPYPGAYTFFEKLRLKVHRARVADEETTGTAGQVVSVQDESLLVQTGRGVLELLEVQPASRSSMSAGAFARGYRLQPGCRLG